MHHNMMEKKSSPASFARVAILISGRGSNMEALLDAMDGDYPARPALVISDRGDALGLTKAKKRAVKTCAIEPANYANQTAFEKALKDTLIDANSDIICLAGFMRILSADFIKSFDGRILNIHPSLLPAYKGLNTHKRALSADECETGCSVHIVTKELDAGFILGQKRVPIFPTDSEDTVAARVLREEFQLYPETLRFFIEQHYFDKKSATKFKKTI